jgi:hypothetical protein
VCTVACSGLDVGSVVVVDIVENIDMCGDLCVVGADFGVDIHVDAAAVVVAAAVFVVDYIHSICIHSVPRNLYDYLGVVIV